MTGPGKVSDKVDASFDMDASSTIYSYRFSLNPPFPSLIYLLSRISQKQRTKQDLHKLLKLQNSGLPKEEVKLIKKGRVEILWIFKLPASWHMFLLHQASYL